MQTKYICFTLNNYTNDELEQLKQILTTTTSYFVFGREQGLFGTPHLQGYAEFQAKHRFSWYKKLVPRWHVEQRRGLSTQAAEYCKKEDQNYVEFGTMSNPRPGSRSDLDELKLTLDSGATLAEISQKHFGQWIKYERSIKSYRLVHGQPRSWISEVFVLWGATGTGKTRSVHDSHPRSEIYVWPGEAKWFDGFDNHPIVLFDDFSGSALPLPYLLKLLDRYPFKVPVKGSFAEWNPRVIYITSNIDPQEWYPNAHEEHRRALARRFTKVEHFSNFFSQQ